MTLLPVRRVTPEEISAFTSPYLTEGRKHESWAISNVCITGSTLTARVDMHARYISSTDPGGFHLTLYSVLEFLSQLAIIYGHIWASKPKKTQEAWMTECSVICRRAIRQPEDIRVHMEVTRMRRIRERYLLTATSRVSDASGLFEVKMKGFV